MNLGKAIFRYKEDSSEVIVNMKALNMFLVFIQFLFGLFMMPTYIKYEVAVVTSIASMVPSLILLFLPGLLEDEDIRVNLENIYYTIIIVGLISFIVALYYAFFEGNPEEIVEWFHVWLLPLLLSITYSFISFEMFNKKDKKMVPVANLPQEPLMNINCA